MCVVLEVDTYISEQHATFIFRVAVVGGGNTFFRHLRIKLLDVTTQTTITKIFRKDHPKNSTFIKVFLPTDAQENCFKSNIKIYIKIAPTYFSLITIVRECTIRAC
jgi:hypothetical protein